MNGKWFSWINSDGEQVVINTDYITFIGWSAEEQDIVFEMAGEAGTFCLTVENHARLLKTIGVEQATIPKQWITQ